MNPFLMLSRHAWKTGEMAVAAAQVISRRTNQIVRAGPVPSARDQREFALMGQEKGAAVVESAQAMGVPLLMLNQQIAALAVKQMLAGSAALVSIAASRTAAQSIARQSRFVDATMTSSVVAASQLSTSAAQLARRVSAPVHKRVSGNVRRLAKR